MLRSEEQMSSATMEHLKHTLERVRTCTDGTYSEQSQATSSLLLAELASRNYHLVFGSEVTLAIQTFEMLKRRVEDCTYENKPVRMDDIALTYMEAVNKIRDCFELHLRDERARLVMTNFVETYLETEGSNSDSEIIYILFLYLTRLNGKKLSAGILLHSIVLKTH